MYDVYRRWAEDNGEKPITLMAFGIEVSERGITKDRDNRGYSYVGLGIRI
jgi:phage/plasmid-associated DNA primase